MKALVLIAKKIIQGEKRAFAYGFALAATVLVMGVSLLALSGWFITAAAAAGLVGAGAVFNVFGPSAMVRFLALGRTAARYGERLTTHDATLRALSGLRVHLLSSVLQAPYRSLERLRASTFLNRVTADIEALDGLSLRLVIPGLSGLGVIALSALAVGWLVAPVISWVIALGYGVAPTLIFGLGSRWANRPARRAEAGLQALRSRLIDLLTAREDLVMFGQLQAERTRGQRAVTYSAKAQGKLDRIDRITGWGLDMVGWAVTALALALGARLVETGQITPAQAAIGVFAALALSESVAPVRRALAETGRMRSAARRVTPLLESHQPDLAPVRPTCQTGLDAIGLQVRRDARTAPVFAPVAFSVAPGETLALTGRSGCGKSTILLAAGGQIEPCHGEITWHQMPTSQIDKTAAPGRIIMVPQRHALVGGTIAENLRLSAPTAPPDAIWAALRAVCLSDTVVQKGGLDAQLGFRGAGLSGGEGRRLALARAVLAQPDLLLLDEPTEGLDGPLAAKVLAGIRRHLPHAAILMAAHRPQEVATADRVLRISSAEQ